ncbi:MAG TPA: adenosylhomocysteinase, partial [Magnetospirillaceae bacterium]|nr:adenosylhomocysteinase [Magnetospirillaceae bacterium]
MSRILDAGLHESGRRKIEWVKPRMPVLSGLARGLSGTFKGVSVAMSIHLEAKTAYLAEVLVGLGAKVAITGSNPLSTQDDVAAALARTGAGVYAWRGISEADQATCIRDVLAIDPDLVLDDGGDLTVALALRGGRHRVKAVTEETTTGLKRLRALAREGRLPAPVIAVNDALSKCLFDNRYGTGQSSWDGIMRTTNLTVCGKTVVVAGFGWCGRGLALRARGLGANVIVTEVDPVKAMEAYFDGFQVMPMEKAASLGDIFVTATGNINIVDSRHFGLLKDGCVLCNAGHFDVEVQVKDLGAFAKGFREVRPNIREYELPAGRKVYLLGEGRLVNLACGDGHPAEIMDLSFALQLLCLAYGLERGEGMERIVHKVPDEVDRRV